MNTLGGDDARYLTQNMEALGRVELPTNGLGNRCSIHLSYRAEGSNKIISCQKKSLGNRCTSAPPD